VDDELQLATAVLLIRASVIDGVTDVAEIAKLSQLLKSRFELSSEDVDELITQAGQKEADAVDLYSFTRVITKKLELDGRRRVVEMLWEMAFADGVLDDYEANLIWRVSELVGVSTRERVELRQAVVARREDKP
jgi:uncharacterized tellurite resistance protein B-like protein